MSQKILGTIEKGLGASQLGPDEFLANLITGSLDLEGDITPASGCTPSSGQVPLLWQHDPKHVVGVARYKRVGDKIVLHCTLIPQGTTAEGDLARVVAKGDYGVGVSAGFQPTSTSRLPGQQGGKKYDSYRLLEASLASVPADQTARITARDHAPERAERRRKGEWARRTQRAHEVHQHGLEDAEAARAQAAVARSAPEASPAPPPPIGLANIRAARAAADNQHANQVLAGEPRSQQQRQLNARLLAYPHGRPSGFADLIDPIAKRT